MILRASVRGVEVHTATKSSLDGSPEIALQIIQVALTAIAAIPPAIASLLDRRRVSKIRLGDIEIENPTREQWETLWQKYLDRENTE